jgi:hypothetical protein
MTGPAQAHQRKEAGSRGANSRAKQEEQGKKAEGAKRFRLHTTPTFGHWSQAKTGSHFVCLVGGCLFLFFLLLLRVTNSKHTAQLTITRVCVCGVFVLVRT